MSQDNLIFDSRPFRRISDQLDAYAYATPYSVRPDAVIERDLLRNEAVIRLPYRAIPEETVELRLVATVVDVPEHTVTVYGEPRFGEDGGLSVVGTHEKTIPTSYQEVEVTRAQVRVRG